LPVVPQLAAPVLTQTPRESSLPAAMATQRPGDEGRAQLRQAPVQALSQQTLSTHWFDLHSLEAVQLWPFCLGPQVPFTHAIPSPQSASLLHPVVQAPFTQRNGWHSWTPGARQVPTPSQVPAVFSRFPVPEQDGIMQIVSRGYLAQAPRPSQRPVVPQLAGPLSRHRPRGSATPRSIGQQVPSRCGRLQELHAPLQARLQQTPSLQWLDLHSLSAAQAAPFILGPQLPATHSWLLPHCPSDVVQDEKQRPLLVSHANGAQMMVAPGLHWPKPLHA
jgi:hypothetical protein